MAVDRCGAKVSGGEVAGKAGAIGNSGRGPHPEARNVKASPATRDRLQVAPAEYAVRKGETLWAIGRRYSMSVKDILEFNPHLAFGRRRHEVYPGERIALRRGPVAPESGGKTPEGADLEAVLVRAERAHTVSETPGPRTRAPVQGPEKPVIGEEPPATAAQTPPPRIVVPIPVPARPAVRLEDPLPVAVTPPATVTPKPELSGPDRPAEASAHDADLARIIDLTEGPRYVYQKETDPNGFELKVRYPRQLDDETRALGTRALEVASPAQKAMLIRNLWEGIASVADQQKMLEILETAKRQGQLDPSLDALHALEVRTALFFKVRMLDETMATLGSNPRNLDRLAAIVAGSARGEDLQRAVDLMRPQQPY